MVVTNFFLMTLLALQQSPEPPGVKYTVAAIGAIALLIVSVISASISVFGLFMSRRNQSALQREQAGLAQANQKELAMMQSKLTLQTQMELEKAKSELVQKTQERLEFYKSELTAKNQQEIEFLRSRLGEEGKERDARRDYEYDARKRLYTEVEPIRFHLYEALEEAHYRVRSLARTARSGNLEGGQSWLSGPGYYLLSTIYKLLTPVVHFRLLQRRMTFIDFSLDRDIASQYMLLRLYVRSFTDDFIFASLSPTLRYEPNSPQALEFVTKEPAVFLRQGLVLGELESIADILTAKEDEKARAIEFGEFERLFDQGQLDDNLQGLVNLFTFFSPTLKPVLARQLIVQAYFAQLIISTYRSNGDSSDLPARLNELLADEDLQSSLSWSDGKPDFGFVRSYWQPRIERL